MTFVNPIALLLLVILLPLVIFFVWRDRRRHIKLGKLGNPILLMSSSPISPTYRFLKMLLWTATAIFLIIAFARPVWGEEVSLVEAQGVSVFVILDVSRSMNAQDISPSRLARAKLAIQDLFTGLAGNELGMILFAGSAFVQFPLTVDNLSATTFIQAASSDAISDQGTNIESALRLAIESFHQTLSSKRYIVLISDGENFDGDVTGAAEIAGQQGIVIYTLGFGTPEGSPVPFRDDTGSEVGFETNSSGNRVLSTLDEDTLTAIAARTGGVYQRVGSSGVEITSLIQMIRAVPAGRLSDYKESREIERFGIFLAFALISLSLEIMITEFHRKPE